MSGLRGRLKRLERDTEGKTVIECPTCGEAFTLYGDPADYLVYLWRQDYGGENHDPPVDPAVVKLAEHEHDPGAFVEKSSGLPFLSREVSGINLGGSFVGMEDPGG